MFQAGFNTSVVVVGTTLLGIAAGVIGTFAMLRKRSLMSDVLAHATLPGIALAFIVVTMLGGQGRSMSALLVGAAITGILGVLAVQGLVRATRLSEDAAMGVVLSTFFGAGVVLLSIVQAMQTGNQGGLKSFIYGQTAAMHVRDAMLMGGIALIAVLAAALLLKEFTIVCFNEEFARVGGWPVTIIDLVIMALVVLVTVAGLQAVGLILVVAMLIVPTAAARFWTDRLRVMVVLAAVIGGMSGYIGSVASALLPRSPAGAVIVLVAGALFFVSMLAAPSRGIVAALVRRVRLNLRVAREHLLRALHEDGAGGETMAQLTRRGVARTVVLRLVLAGMVRKGMLLRRGDRWMLTPAGEVEGARLTRNHRLWEQYLVRYAHVAASHVDWSADAVEHVLSPELVRELEAAVEAAA